MDHRRFLEFSDCPSGDRKPAPIGGKRAGRYGNRSMIDIFRLRLTAVQPLQSSSRSRGACSQGSVWWSVGSQIRWKFPVRGPYITGVRVRPPGRAPSAVGWRSQRNFKHVNGSGTLAVSEGRVPEVVLSAWMATSGRPLR